MDKWRAPGTRSWIISIPLRNAASPILIQWEMIVKDFEWLGGCILLQVHHATFASCVQGQPTFLNLNEPYPRQIFTVVIWGRDRHFFNNAPEVLYRGKKVCVTGLVKSFRGKPEIIVVLPSQIAEQ